MIRAPGLSRKGSQGGQTAVKGRVPVPYDGLEKQRACQKIYYDTHRNEILAQQKKHRKAHPEERRVSRHKYNIEHHEEKLAYNRQYNETHRAEIKEQRRSYRKTHRADETAREGIRRALKRGVLTGGLVAIKEIYQQAREKKRIRCYLCNKLIPWGHRQVDHIMPLSRGGKHTASNLAVACTFCNLSKHTKMPEEVGLLV